MKNELLLAISIGAGAVLYQGCGEEKHTVEIEEVVTTDPEPYVPECEDGETKVEECGDACIGTRIDDCVDNEWVEGDCDEFTTLAESNELEFDVASVTDDYVALKATWGDVSKIVVNDTKGNKIFDTPNGAIVLQYEDQGPAGGIMQEMLATIRSDGYAILSENRIALEVGVMEGRVNKVLVCDLPRAGESLEYVIGENCALSSEDQHEDRLAVPDGFTGNKVLIGKYVDNDVVLQEWDVDSGDVEIRGVKEASDERVYGVLTSRAVAYFDSEDGACNFKATCPVLKVVDVRNGRTVREVRDGVRNGPVGLTGHGKNVAYTHLNIDGVAKQVHVYDVTTDGVSMFPQQPNGIEVAQPKLTERHLLYQKKTSDERMPGMIISVNSLSTGTEATVYTPATKYAASSQNLVVSSPQKVEVCKLR